VILEILIVELIIIFDDGSVMVFDVRSYVEFAMSYIFGVVNVLAKSGVVMFMYVFDVVEIGRLVGGIKVILIVFYCNGSNCGKSKWLVGELLSVGYMSVCCY